MALKQEQVVMLVVLTLVVLLVTKMYSDKQVVMNEGSLLNDDPTPVLPQGHEFDVQVTPKELLEKKRNQGPLEVTDLLPNDINEKWSTVDADGKGTLAYKNFLEGGKHIGVDTIATSLRNANYGVRSEPINPRHNVGPWQNSSINPDLYRKPLDPADGSSRSDSINVNTAADYLADSRPQGMNSANV